MLWDYCRFTIVSPGLFSDALHLHTSGNKRFRSLPALQGLGHREQEEGAVRAPSTVMMLHQTVQGFSWTLEQRLGTLTVGENSAGVQQLLIEVAK